MRVGLWRKLRAEKLMLLNCGCWKRLLRVPWAARRSNQSILKEIRPEYSLEGLRLKVKFQYFGNLMAKNWLIRKDPDAGTDWRQEKKGMTEDEMAGWHQRLNGWIWVNSRSWWWTGSPGMLQSMGSHRVRHDWLNWNELSWIMFLLWLAIVTMIYFLSGYWLWKLTDIFYYCDYVTVTHLIPLYHYWSTEKV